MQRFKIIIEYDGRPFVGWQRQKEHLSVQQVIEEAIEKFTGVKTTLYGSGRTDAGVHGLGQVAHFSIEKDIETDGVVGALNFHLKPYPVAILMAEKVQDDFHARFDAVQRHYTYKILNRRPRLTFQKGLVWHVPKRLDVDAMQAGANHLIGMHDFTTFRHVHCQSDSPVKTLDYLKVERLNGSDEIHIHAGARSFLHHQIRSITGTLSMVGHGQWAPEDVKIALQACDRSRLGLNAPPDGLYFRKVDY
ncbi:tRNA pseudouridine(38-40) synthase TruA [Temperatibacter marinus]|uniref:tRNA pseudouridine synthase A n=1 Tax=Temperatibacter marinus TaxID=1456591 RepID=A0AA52EK55_9PROT|nr:tRNA pseudouridine(38-40) synthase TruA [Temperatibacter marinus]WND03734.1 tRNA pseudouridine(38-40) synthase TruA [Temperatibacter marinus]